MLRPDDIASWIDKRIDAIENAVWAWIAENPSLSLWVFGLQGYLGLTLAAQTGHGYVDVLRLGDGIKQGGWGWAQDGLRVASIVPAVAGATRLGQLTVRRIVGPITGPSAVQAARLQGNLAHSAGGRCTWISVARALRLIQSKGGCPEAVERLLDHRRGPGQRPQAPP